MTESTTAPSTVTDSVPPISEENVMRFITSVLTHSPGGSMEEDEVKKALEQLEEWVFIAGAMAGWFDGLYEFGWDAERAEFTFHRNNTDQEN